jgi:nucleoside 2-deoxyribosyltransferase
VTPIVYLAGPIHGCTDGEANDWRAYVKTLLPNTVDPMRRDYRGVEDDNVNNIISGDKADIDASDAVIANCPAPSYGTAMEILYAWSLRKLVVVVAPRGPVSPWLRGHSTTVVHTLDEAVDAVLREPQHP